MRPAKTPRQWHSGTEPMTARSDLKLRFLLSVIFAPLFLLTTVGFAVWASQATSTSAPSRSTLTAFAVACGVLTLFALVDLWVVIRRRRTEL
jgi:cation transporter-like permease